MFERPTWTKLCKRLYWDLVDSRERVYYGYWLIWQVPGLFGNLLRARYLAPRMKRAGKNLSVSPGCRFRSVEHLEVGENFQMGFDNFIQARGGVTIGDNVVFAPSVKVWSVNHEYNDPDLPVVEQGHKSKPVRIGDNVFVASNAFVLPGAQLPEGCIVSAGAVVGSKEYPPFAILAGNPARIIGYRGGKKPLDKRGAETTRSPVVKTG